MQAVVGNGAGYAGQSSALSPPAQLPVVGRTAGALAGPIATWETPRVGGAPRIALSRIGVSAAPCVPGYRRPAGR